ncbi:UDP-glycosyltransferase 92A1 [Punica granatum]|uniref:Glycosyltransferase n=2 Tax=Punica granatum TaxID=22663 RepID=A0A218WA42_PUNGR|nr:UDP-glycosyltransferase 92A1 [Punica granatum]OWM69220.1 hypothetical protein CDL15_Pgr025407 [Punica granatum]PKI61099.1 hypothetical protein CRG98_018544 [Punica granatum]
METAKTEDEAAENIVIFPFMAQGHIIPFLALALHIEKTAKRNNKSFTINFVSTPLNIRSLRSSLPPSSSIRLLEIPFSASDADSRLPPGAENTDVLPYHLIIHLLEASTSLRPAFRALLLGLIAELGGRKPLCVIADIFFGWTADVARELGVFHAVFSGASGYGLACYYSAWINLPHRNRGGPVDDEFELPDFPETSKFHLSQLPLSILEADGTDPWSLFQAKNLPVWVNSNGILFNTVEEFDNIGFRYFVKKLERPVWAVGPILLPKESRSSVSTQPGPNSELCAEWLNSKPAQSVLYISFGSQNTISASQMMQLATALDASGRDFIWVVRPPLGCDVNSEFETEKWLPEGFERRMEESRKGLLVRKWAPQVEILSHEAVSAFLTHCGWNSVLEGLSRGLPLLGWPMAAEQFFNARLLEAEVGVCVEVARGKASEIRWEDVRDKIEAVMGDTEKGQEMRRRASEVRSMIESAMKVEGGCTGPSLTALDEFFKVAATSREKTEDGRNGVLI